MTVAMLRPCPHGHPDGRDACKDKAHYGIGWHTLRHTFGTLVKSQGADVATQAFMRHANVSITMDRYVQAIGEAKRAAQHAIVGVW